jgi:hypothetical protein
MSDEHYIKWLCRMTERFGWGKVVRHIGLIRRIYNAGRM